MYLGSTIQVLWLAQPVLQAIAAGVMYKRKLHRKFPIFFAYLVSQVPGFAIIFSAFNWGTYVEYFYGYWFCNIVSLAMGFKVIHEIFLDVFRPYHALKDLGSVLFKWSALVMVLVAIVVAASSSVSSDGPIVEAVITAQRCVRVIQVGLVLLLLVFSKYVGISWRHFSFGVSLGFGSFALSELLVVALHASERISQNAADLTNIVGYNVSVLVWVIYSAIKSPARETINTLLTSQRWDHSLGDIQNTSAPESLIPAFENIVDRAFSRMIPEVTPPSTFDQLEKLAKPSPAPTPEKASSASSKS
ncbi:MAG TPA: hypothetical protein VLK33_14510 [Terriglobales bacterium]|nr:hypothetical protein [Terriglobales bacterium]